MNRTIHIFIKLFFLYSVSLCQWSTDQSTPQSFGSGIQAQVASTSDGGLYIAWLSDGNYHVYLQYLNHLGEAQLGDGGMVVSDNQNASWIAVYHLNLSVDHEAPRRPHWWPLSSAQQAPHVRATVARIRP